VNSQWYLFAWDPSREAMRTFSLARLRSPRATAKKFNPDSAISVPELLAEGLGVAYKPKTGDAVRIRFAPDLAKVIGERIWHPSQKIRKAADGSVEMSLAVSDTKELRNWIMSWGPRAEVLAPLTLRETVAKLARETAELYSLRNSEVHERT
jgi:predicted DNA-binding transcriptional regulator YafY